MDARVDAPSVDNPVLDQPSMDQPTIDGPAGDRVEASAPCTVDLDCDDGRFCTGVERCMPGAAGASPRGCVSATSACMTGQTCDETMRRCVNTGCSNPDMDGDGHRAMECGGDDCDDGDVNRYPGRAEVCDAMNHDEDCDGTTFGFRDADMDGYADARCCNLGPTTDGGMSAMTCGTDCQDTNANVHPTAPEVCNGTDDDCNGRMDEGVQRTYYPDTDHDGFGDPRGTPTMGCAASSGRVENNTDCDDTNPIAHPGAMEICDVARVDENCSGAPNEGCGCTGDGTQACPMARGVCAGGTQRCVMGMYGACSIQPQAESCNRLDDDCDGMVDNGVTVTCYTDNDNDGYAAMGSMASQVCPVSARADVGHCPTGSTDRAPTTGAVDCLDTNAQRNPGATETCNSVDDNCDGRVDEGVTVACYADTDNDGFAPAGTMAVATCPASDRAIFGGCPLGLTNRAPSDPMSTDCNPTNSLANPSAPEVCDGPMLDENCNDMMNEGCSCSGSSTRPCPLSGACAAGMQTCAGGMFGACSIMPLSEVCDGIDNNCNGDVDEGVLVRCYADTDNDTYAATSAAPVDRCPVSGRAAVAGCPTGYTNRAPDAGLIDCVDSSAAINPAATEVCNGSDDNCNATIDEGVSITCFSDADNDTYAPTGATPTRSCPAAGRDAVGGCPTGTTNRAPTGASAIDCNPTIPSIRPGATEVCNATDDNCNGVTDEGVTSAFYPDSDGDGFGNARVSPTFACSAPVGYVTNNGDCNDASRPINPTASEVCDVAMVDENCSGTANEGCMCAGTMTQPCPGALGVCAAGVQRCTAGAWSACSITPTAEICNGMDDNCNGTVDEGNPGGGAACGTGQSGVCAPGRMTCTGGSLMCVRNVAPSAEVCDSQDNNCDGMVDNGIAAGGACTTSLPGVCTPGTMRCVSGVTTCVQNVASSGEVCDSLDNNCNGAVDESVTVVCYRDNDNDTFPRVGTSAANVCPDATRPTVGNCPSGYTNRAPATGANDCYDSASDVTLSAQARPNQTGYFATTYPGTCCIGIRCMPCSSYDWNCNGTNDLPPVGRVCVAGVCSLGSPCGGGGYVYPTDALCAQTVTRHICTCPGCVNSTTTAPLPCR